MTRLLGAPLVAAGAIALVLAAIGVTHPVAAAILATVVLAATALLTAASADGPRRTLWWSCSLAAAGLGVRTLVPLPSLDADALVLVARIREPLATALHTLVPEPESAILLGIVLGERSGIPRELRDAFAATGTAHLLAISGFNMTLVATAVAFGLRGRARPPLVAAATVLAVAAYSVLVGPAASVARAACMSAVGALALALGRRGAAANALGAAVVVMLVVDPFAVGDVGFVLSVTATAGLIAWQRGVSERLARLPAPFADALATTVAASIPTLPVVAAVFGRISVVSPLANLVAVPLFAPIMVLGAATATVGALVPGAAAPLAAAAYASAYLLRRSVEAFAAVPLASVEVPAGPLAAVATTAAIIAARLLLPRARIPALPALPRLAIPRVPLAPLAVVAGVGALAAGVIVAQGMPRASAFRLHALDVGQGDAFLIESAGRYALIDGGPDGALLMRRLGEVLPPWHRRIDVIALTHEHADHGNGLLAVIDRYDVGLAIEPAAMADVPLTRMWAERLARSGVARRAVSSGAVVRVGATTLRVLAPGPRAVAVPSLVIRAEVGAATVLFMGDATDDAIADLLLAPEELAASVYVPPHHGADSAHASALAAAARASVAVISSGLGNRYGHPTAGTLAALAGVAVYRTDRYGTVVLTLDADPLVVRTAKAAVPPDRGGSVPRASPAR